MTTPNWLKCYDFPFEMRAGTVALIDDELVEVEKSLWLNPSCTAVVHHSYNDPTSKSKTTYIESTKLVRTYLLTEF